MIVLTKHGCFGKYLDRIEVEPIVEYHHYECGHCRAKRYKGRLCVIVVRKMSIWVVTVVQDVCEYRGI